MKRIVKILLCLSLIINVYPVFAQDINSNLDHIAVNNEFIRGKDLLNVSVRDGDTVKIGGVGNPKNLLGIVLNDVTYPKTIDGNGNWFVVFSVLNMKDGEYTIYLDYIDKSSEPLTDIFVKDGKSSDSKDEAVVSKPFLGSTLYYIIVAISIPLLISFGWYLNVFFQRFSKK